MNPAYFIDNYCGELIVTEHENLILDANYGIFW